MVRGRFSWSKVGLQCKLAYEIWFVVGLLYIVKIWFAARTSEEDFGSRREPLETFLVRGANPISVIFEQIFESGSRREPI